VAVCVVVAEAVLSFQIQLEVASLVVCELAHRLAGDVREGVAEE
jgi:hypothetical protein